jgi:phosphonoacetaldehyde hydrolase
MQMESQGQFKGPVRAVIFDWAGTTVDYGSRAPVEAFTEIFRRHGVSVTVEEARRPMGANKKEHIRQMLAMESVASRWRRAHGVEPCPGDVDSLYSEFIPLQAEVIVLHAGVIPGTLETVRSLRECGIKIGSTTGYTREMMAPLLEASAQGGYLPDAVVCADEVPAGRPAPWMALQAAMQLGVYPVSACVKVGDTVADIAEGLNAGMWSVGITKTGNELGLSQAEVEALPGAELAHRLAAASERLLAAGAHYTIEGLAELPAVIESINRRLSGVRHSETASLG